jgi:hypothetical protein
MNSNAIATDLERLIPVINTVNELAADNTDLLNDMITIRQLMLVASSINMHRNAELKYRYPYNTGFTNQSKVEPVSVEEVESAGIEEDTVVFELLFSARHFYRITQLQPEEFLQLLKLIVPLMETTPMNFTNDSEEKKESWRTNKARPSTRRLKPPDMLLAWLIGLTGIRDIFMATTFSCNEATMIRVFNYVTEIILLALKDELQWPDAEERKLFYNLFPIYEKAVIVLDGTHCQIQIPFELEDEESYYSSYKHYHTQLYLIYIDPHGFFRRIEGPWPGKNADRAVFMQSDVYANSSEYLAKDEMILVDGGFRGEGPILYPYNKTELEKAGDEKEKYKAYNELLTESRSLVEHAIHRLKSRAAILASRFMKDKAKQLKIVQCAAMLFNWTRKIRIIKIQSLLSAND